MRRLASALLLLGPVLAIGLWPVRPLIVAVWPGPVEELVLADGDWVLTSVLPGRSGVDDRGVRARTRPLSLVEAQLRNGQRLRGYLIEQAKSTDAQGALLLATGPETLERVPVSELKMLFYPNKLSVSDRFRLAMSRLKNRQPLS